MLSYIFAAISMVSLGFLGILSKLADRHGCSPLATTTVVFTSSTALTAFYVGFFKRSGFVLPGRLILVALVFGIITALASWVFLYGIRFGKITTSWMVINLSAAVPTVVSTLVYHERLGTLKIVVLLLVAAAILLLWKDMQEKGKGAQNAAESSAGARFEGKD